LDRLKQAIGHKKRSPDKSFSVLYLDLDNFKNINDSLGHVIGDQFLVMVAERLKANLRSTDTIARFGGDEFILLLEETPDMEKADEIAQRILESLSAPGYINGHEVYITASIGIISSEMDYDDPEQLLRDADIAMYSAKSQGRGRYEVFNLDMRNNFLEQISLESRLTHAVHNDELRLVYQPIVSLTTGSLVGLEALIRWQYSQNEYIHPKDFLPIAEKNTGLSLAIDRWVLHHATCQLSEWLKEFPADLQLTVSVNLSAKYLRHMNVADELKQILEETGLEGRRLKLEITESAIMENNQHIMSMMKGLQAMEVDIHIDDFGTGYSSLAYLHQFQVQALKIDRSFISNTDQGKHMPELVRTVLHLARDLQLEVIAEGVETETQLEKLQKLGCEYCQGFLLSPPIDAKAARVMLEMIQAGQNPFAHLKLTN
jgi:diguanylate cyclase (GGDEF)-like protein